MDRTSKQIQRLIYSLILVVFIMFESAAAAGEIDVPLIPSLFEADCPVTVENDWVSFEIDKRAKVLIKLPGVAEVFIDYEAEGYFRLEYITATPSEYKIDPKFLIGYPLSKGKGSLKINFRHTLNWSDKTYPLLMLEGTGKFTIKKLKAVTVSDLSDYRPEKNSAFFWRPENMRSNLMNFITPVYWDFSRKVLWTSLLGTIFLVTVLAFSLFCFYRKQSVMRYLPAIALSFTLVSGLHFAVRFVPMVNGRFYLPEKEKIKKYYPLPELGQLVATAIDNTRNEDIVVVMTGKGDWFAKKAVCFNLPTLSCVFQKRRDGQYWGLHRSINAWPKEINMIVYYNSDESLPSGYDKIYQLNKNVFMAKKR